MQVVSWLIVLNVRIAEGVMVAALEVEVTTEDEGDKLRNVSMRDI